MDTVGFPAPLPTGRNKFPYVEMRKIAGETSMVDEMSSSILDLLSLRNLMYIQVEHTVGSEERYPG